MNRTRKLASPKGWPSKRIAALCSPASWTGIRNSLIQRWKMIPSSQSIRWGGGGSRGAPGALMATRRKMGSGGDAADTESQLYVYFGQDRLVLSGTLGGRWKVDQVDYSLQDQIAVVSFLGVFAEQGVF